MTENQIATKVLDAAFIIHRELGPGLLESAYEAALAHLLTEMGFKVRRQVVIPVTFRGIELGDGYRADLIVNDKVIIELKAQEAVPPVAATILLTYLKFADMRLGLLINFHEPQLKNGIKRVVNNLQPVPELSHT